MPAARAGAVFRGASAALGLASVGALALAAPACARPALMCTSAADCGDVSSCVAGRCVAHGAVPAIAAARRLVYAPIDVGYVGASADGACDGCAPPAIAVLGRGGSGSGARVLLRFAVPLSPDETVLEAYLLLDRAPGVDADPAPIALHAAPIVEPWSGADVRWARQPRTADAASPVTRVPATASSPVRLDVRGLVERWRRRDGSDLGVAVVADESTPSGIAFALAPLDAPTKALPRHQADAPRLELYVKR